MNDIVARLEDLIKQTEELQNKAVQPSEIVYYRGQKEAYIVALNLIKQK